MRARCAGQVSARAAGLLLLPTHGACYSLRVASGGHPVVETTSAKEIREFNGGEVLVEEGERNEYFYVILSGSVAVSQSGRRVRTLNEGDIFGLEARFLDRPSSVRATVASKSRIAAYAHGALNDILYGHPQMVERMLASALKQLEQTTQLAGEHSARAGSAYVNMRFLEDGEVVLREGEQGDEVYKLVSTEGGLRVTRGGQELGVINQPEAIFGEMSGILGQRRTTTLTSVGHSVVQVYPRAHLQELIEENPAFARQLVEHLAGRLARVRQAGTQAGTQGGGAQH